jgi:hypothetical protein
MRSTVKLAVSKLTMIVFIAFSLWRVPTLRCDESPKTSKTATETDSRPATWDPVRSTGSGLLLEPPLDLHKFTREEFLEISGSVGKEKINKQWTNAVKQLPPHSRKGVNGLAQHEVKDYMLQARQLFDEGAAIPISDVGLISTQEDIIRRPMFNHISAFSNETARVYLLVQKTYGDKGWGYFSIVQDQTTDPWVDYFAEIKGKDVKLEGISCYKCHSSGPLAIHPVREDLVSDARLAAALSEYIAEQPISQFHFPSHETPPDYGTPLKLKACAECHDKGAVRAPLFRVHSHPIRILADFGYMPPKHRLTADEAAELKAWLEQKQ